MNTDVLIKKLTADKKKLAVMLMLLGVMGVMWGRMLIKQGPKSAAAGVDNLVRAVVPTDNVVTAAVEETVKARQLVLIDDHGPVTRDLFSLDASHFQKLDGGNATLEAAGKSDSDSPDDEFRLRARESAVRAAAGGLKLQTTLLGSPNRAMVNGEVLEEGATIQGFVLKEVRSRSVLVEKDGVQIILEM